MLKVRVSITIDFSDSKDFNSHIAIKSWCHIKIGDSKSLIISFAMVNSYKFNIMLYNTCLSTFIKNVLQSNKMGHLSSSKETVVINKKKIHNQLFWSGRIS